jgi:hypothetical protein
MYAEALWIQEIKSLFNSMKTLKIVLEFAMYSLEHVELEIKFFKKISDPPVPTRLPYFFPTTLAETQHFLYLA